jgi:phage terminase large subunit-like protein
VTLGRVTIGDVLARVPDAVWLLPREQISAAVAKLSKWDPLLFAAWYFPHHLRDGEHEPITFSRFHVDLAARALRWARPNPEPMSERHADLAPRESGKSTWKFLILPAWAAAHEHLHFVAAFADSGPQAEMHLRTFKRELESNPLLQQDFPRLCTPSRRTTGVSDSDNKSMYLARNGFVFAAKGIDASSLGMKVGDRRPDMLLLDDIEPDGAKYSLYQKEQRLATLQNSILPLAVKARVELSGTVTMPGSITHDLVKVIIQPDEPPEQWVIDERFQVHYYDAIVVDPETGERASLWPEKWSLEFLESIEHTRSYRLNYANDPMAMDGLYWSQEDIPHGSTFPATMTILSIDPAVTTNEKSDYTGLAVVAGNKALQKCRIRMARQVKVAPGTPLRNLCLQIMDQFPDIAGILIETNQGGDTWRAILHTMPVRVATIHQDESKEQRAADLLNDYQMGRVEHEVPLPVAETQMIAFPKGHDDIVDAIGSGVRYFLPKTIPRQRRSSSQSYV